MKKRLTVIMIMCVLLLFAVGCEKLPEEDEPTNTSKQTTAEQRDYYSDAPSSGANSTQAQNNDDAATLDESQAPKSDGGTSSAKSASGTRINGRANISILGKESLIPGGAFANPWRPILPFFGIYSPYAWTGRSNEPEPDEPVPTPEPRPTIIVYLNGRKLAGNAYINTGGFPMIPLKPVITALGGKITPDETSYMISVGGSYIYVDPSKDTLIHNGHKYVMGTKPEIVDDQLYTPLGMYLDLFGAKYTYDGIALKIQIASVASPTTP